MAHADHPDRSTLRVGPTGPAAPDDRLDRGLAYDLTTLLERRRALKLFAGAGLVVLAGCTASSNSATSVTFGTAGTSGSGTRSSGSGTSGSGSSGSGTSGSGT